jgi:hypothetical protein
MPSTYSSLKIQLMGTGENSGTWGTITNTNLGTAIEEAITGSADVAFSSANVTLTLTDTNSSQAARNLRLNLTGTTGGARDLIVPAIEKIYIINNGCADTITVKNATGTGISVPPGKTEYVYNNGTSVVEAINHLTSLTLDTPLPVASGGTGGNTAANARTSLGLAIGTDVLAPNGSGANLTSLNASSLASGTVPDARFPATLPAVSGANLTNLNATALASGTVPDARFPATLPAVSGANLTSLNASSLASGTVGTARLASGTANNTTFLRGDGTWAAAGGGGATGQSGQVFTSSGTFTIPTGVNAIKVTALGGGGGGATGSPGNNSGGQGGGGGGLVTKYLTGLTPGLTLSVTVGAGAGAGGTGGTSSVASGTQSITTVSATGGTRSGGGGSGADLVITGPSGNGGGSFQVEGSFFQLFGGNGAGSGGDGYYGFGGGGSTGTGGPATVGNGGGGGGGGGSSPGGGSPGGSGRLGLVILEW